MIKLKKKFDGITFPGRRKYFKFLNFVINRCVHHAEAGAMLHFEEKKRKYRIYEH
jgi:hypothetical protein